MMLTVADANDSQGTSQPCRLPEPIDGEIVESTLAPASTPARGTSESGGSATGPGTSSDDDFRQYQQFLEFQKFQEWKRQQGESESGERAQPRTGQAWWKWVRWTLGFKFVRRLLTLFFVLLLIWFGIHYYFSDNSSEDNNGAGVPGNQNPRQAPVTATTPQDAIVAIYGYLAYKPDVTCKLLSDSAKADFARDFAAPNCDAAAQKLHTQVSKQSAYANPSLIDGVTVKGADAEVSSCKSAVDGGPRLGTFFLKRNEKMAWTIEGHQNEPADCVTG